MGCLAMDKCKYKSSKSIYCQEKAKAKPSINRMGN
jgi:hypothetical protein